MPSFAKRQSADRKPTPPRVLETAVVFVAVAVVAIGVLIAGDLAASLPKPQALALPQAFTLPKPSTLIRPRLALVDHQFQGCDAARAIGFTNIPVGYPSYREFMDGDHDGLACEPFRSRY